MLPEDVPEPRLPEEGEVVLPAPLVELPYSVWQRSRSRPLRPTHWLGTVELPAAPLLLSVLVPPDIPPVEGEPMLEPVLGLVLLPVLEPAAPRTLDPVVPLGEPLIPEPVLPPVAPADEPAEPALEPPALPAPPAPDCAHATLATPTNAAATAAAIVLTIW
jgi:hypothetical protein